MPSREQWDRLASLWHACEGDGLRPEHLHPFATQIEAPCLVVGSGLGLVTDALSRSGIDPAVGLDSSPAMAERAQALRGLRTIVGTIEELPFASQSMQTIVVTTGVLDPTRCTRALAEIARVVHPDGRALLAVFEAGPGLRRVGEPIGVIDAHAQHTGRIAQLWSQRRDPQAMARLVASFVACDLPTAHQRLAGAHDFLRSWFESLDEFVDLARAQGIPAPEDHVAACFDFSLPDHPGDDALLAGSPLALAAAHAFPVDSVRVLLVTAT